MAQPLEMPIRKQLEAFRWDDSLYKKSFHTSKELICYWVSGQTVDAEQQQKQQ